MTEQQLVILLAGQLYAAQYQRHQGSFLLPLWQSCLATANDMYKNSH